MLPILLLLLSAAEAKVPFADQARSHWAFQPLRRPAVPSTRQDARSPLDAFLLAKMDAAGLSPTPPAAPRTLIRRLHLNLTGLPPTPDEADAFAADPSPARYRRVVDDLLARPAFGERFGRLWLDLARYADTNGYERDGNKPSAWRYRDYVIDALNRKLPYNRFVTEQVAGDELPDADRRSRIGTTFLRLGTWDDEPANESADRYDQLDDVLGTTASVFLASTIRCARCHDHKFEPYSLRDYYSLLAVFEPLKRPQKGRDDLDYPVGDREEMDAYRRASARREAGLREIDRMRRAVHARIREHARRDATKRPVFDRAPPRTAVQWLGFAHASEAAALKGLADRHKAVEARPLPALPRAYVWMEQGPTIAPTVIFRRGNPNLTGAEVAPAVPVTLKKRDPGTPVPQPHSTGRRLWLAKWLTSPDNPLTARVIVNRLWAWHFGKGLVATPSDFGLLGDRPSHPELLDWLACELVDSGWRLEHVHRLILLSDAYQRSSAHDGPDAARKLALFGRWRQRRLEAEVVRDTLLSLSGQLHREMAGPGVYPALPPAVLATQSRPGLGWGKSDATQSSRRSIYVFAKRTLQLPELELLDAADSNMTCEARPASTTAPQALTFLNGAFSNEQAAHFAARLLREADSDAARVRRAFELALSRPPRADELRAVLTFLDRQRRTIDGESPTPSGDSARRALVSFCLVLLNTSELFYLD